MEIDTTTTGFNPFGDLSNMFSTLTTLDYAPTTVTVDLKTTTDRVSQVCTLILSIGMGCRIAYGCIDDGYVLVHKLTRRPNFEIAQRVHRMIENTCSHTMVLHLLLMI